MHENTGQVETFIPQRMVRFENLVPKKKNSPILSIAVE